MLPLRVRHRERGFWGLFWTNKGHCCGSRTVRPLVVNKRQIAAASNQESLFGTRRGF